MFNIIIKQAPPRGPTTSIQGVYNLEKSGKTGKVREFDFVWKSQGKVREFG